jgi:dTDP-4-dehydrorhamnose 3,5-epimerase
MKFSPVDLPGVWLIDLEKHVDDRGWFARTWCAREFAEHGICADFKQSNLSFNAKAGTLRGMHIQLAPHPEAKLVQCVRGAIYDVVVDLRPDSPTHKKWFAAELSEENNRILFIPAGLAHGFQTLTDNSSVFYQMSEFYHPECASGFRWDDPAFEIAWPNTPERTIAPKDLSFGDYQQSDS